MSKPASQITLLGLCIMTLLSSCFGNKIQTDKTLSAKDKAFIQSLHLLDKEEPVYKFYTEYKNSVAGNFFTDRRVATYWIDERDSTKDRVEFAYYKEIASIDTVYYAGATYCPYMLVMRNDSTTFKVSVDGKREEIKAFFKDVMQLWQQTKTAKRGSLPPASYLQNCSDRITFQL